MRGQSCYSLPLGTLADQRFGWTLVVLRPIQYKRGRGPEGDISKLQQGPTTTTLNFLDSLFRRSRNRWRPDVQLLQALPRRPTYVRED